MPNFSSLEFTHYFLHSRPFVAKTSQMRNLCAECSSILYGYQNSEHIFIDQNCDKCKWNGNTNEYVRSVKEIP